MCDGGRRALSVMEHEPRTHSSPERSERDREGRETRILIKVYHQHAHRIYSKTFLGCPTVLTAISDHLIFPRETTLLSSHRVYTGDRVVNEDDRHRHRRTYKRRSPRCRAPVSSSPQARPSCRAPFSSLRPAGACTCSRHHGAISAHDGPKVTATGRCSFAIQTCSISCLMIIIASAACPSCT